MRLRLGYIFLLLLTVASAAIQPLNLTFAVPLVAIIVVIFIAMTNMLAHAISDPKLEAWAHTEVREFIAALILISILTAGVFALTGVSVALTGRNDYINASTGILDGWLTKFDTSFKYLISASTSIRAAATYSPYLNVPLWYVSISYSTNPLAGIAVLLGTLSVASQALTNAIFLTEGIRLLIVFMQSVTPPILLPLAFILRLIPFSRRLGNTLIAVAIAGYVFLPFSVMIADALNGTVDASSVTPTLNTGDLDANPYAMVVAEGLCENVFLRTILSLTDPLFAIVVCLPLYLIPIVGPGLFAICQPLVQYVIFPLINVIFQIIMTLLMVIWEGITLNVTCYSCQVFNTLQPFLSALNNLVILTYIDIIMISTVTVTGARSLSSALGGEWYMAGIQRLI